MQKERYIISSPKNRFAELFIIGVPLLLFNIIIFIGVICDSKSIKNRDELIIYIIFLIAQLNIIYFFIKYLSSFYDVRFRDGQIILTNMWGKVYQEKYEDYKGVKNVFMGAFLIQFTSKKKYLFSYSCKSKSDFIQPFPNIIRAILGNPVDKELDLYFREMMNEVAPETATRS
ncbi:MAG: hypothetical protein JNJ85_06990 [Candidatus Kapabacteria bacterium]|nr:hypothetical protein [Candidatus Kapabacteria bacterium]